MKSRTRAIPVAALVILLATSCQEAPQNEAGTVQPSTEAAQPSGQSGVQDDQSQKDIVKIAMGSPDHSTLVKALQQAEYVDVLSNAGPFTVFAPSNDAFAKLPAGTLENLMKPENKEKLRSILEYHVYIGVLKPDMLQDGQQLGQASGDNIRVGVKDGKITINDQVHVLGTIPASNGIIYLVDGVLLPPSK